MNPNLLMCSYLNQMPRQDVPSVTPWRSTTRIPASASSRERCKRTTSKSINTIPQGNVCFARIFCLLVTEPFIVDWHLPTVSVAIQSDSVTIKVEGHTKSLFRPAVTSIKRAPSCTNWCIVSGSTTNTLDPIVTRTSIFFGTILMKVGSIYWLAFKCGSDEGMDGHFVSFLLNFRLEGAVRNCARIQPPPNLRLWSVWNWDSFLFRELLFDLVFSITQVPWCIMGWVGKWRLS